MADRPVVDEFTAVPGHDEMAPMAVGMIYAFLAGDTSTGIMISREVDELGESPGHVADTFAVMAAAMLVEVCGGQVNARALADRWARKIAARQARVVQARRAKASLSQPGGALRVSSGLGTAPPARPLARPARPARPAWLHLILYGSASDDP